MSNVEGLNELRTFGWSLSGGVDVDNNQYGGEACRGRELEKERGGKERRRKERKDGTIMRNDPEEVVYS